MGALYLAAAAMPAAEIARLQAENATLQRLVATLTARGGEIGAPAGTEPWQQRKIPDP